ncbi:MAG: hypothetical protein ACHQXG_06970 [Nitrososphaerales archaeon]
MNTKASLTLDMSSQLSSNPNASIIIVSKMIQQTTGPTSIMILIQIEIADY